MIMNKFTIAIVLSSIISVLFSSAIRADSTNNSCPLISGKWIGSCENVPSVHLEFGLGNGFNAVGAPSQTLSGSLTGILPTGPLFLRSFDIAIGTMQTKKVKLATGEKEIWKTVSYRANNQLNIDESLAVRSNDIDTPIYSMTALFELDDSNNNMYLNILEAEGSHSGNCSFTRL